MEKLLEFGLAVIAVIVSFKLGQKTAWEYIAKNYIAIHKSTILGPILIKREGNKHGETNHTRRTHKKAYH
jgi:hypothetical protein